MIEECPSRCCTTFGGTTTHRSACKPVYFGPPSLVVMPAALTATVNARTVLLRRATPSPLTAGNTKPVPFGHFHSRNACTTCDGKAPRDVRLSILGYRSRHN